MSQRILDITSSSSSSSSQTQHVVTSEQQLPQTGIQQHLPVGLFVFSGTVLLSLVGLKAFLKKKGGD